MKNIRKVIIVFLILLILILLINNRKLIRNITGIEIEQEVEPLFSYVVYDNQDTENIKVLITVNSENGIEYIECPNGNKINTNGKNNFAIDYIVEKEKNYSFAIKEDNKEQIIQELAINNDSIEETTLKINKITDISGYKVIDIDKKIDLEDYSEVYYKISENGTWVEGTKFSLIDYDLSTNELINEDGTVTVYAKVSNSKTNNEIVINKNFNVDTTEETESIQSDSLLGAIGDNDLKNGKYEVTVSDEIYNVKVYNIDSSLTMSVDTTFGTEEDVATSTEEYAKNMIIVKVNGDLTIDENVTLTSYANKDGYGGPKGMMIYCTGTLTNNGTVSMTARGAYAEGQNVYMWKNQDGSYEYVPAVGAEGGEKVYQKYSTDGSEKNKIGKTGNDGSKRKTGGGGSGGAGCRFMAKHDATSGAGGTGTSYSGGSGGGGAYCDMVASKNANGKQGSSVGGLGGLGYTADNSRFRAGSGAGNKQGNEQYYFKSGSNTSTDTRTGVAEQGTGGLLIMYANKIINSKLIDSNGSKGGNLYTGGGSSGGGSINLFYNEEYFNKGTVIANGGTSVGKEVKGGAGGTGSISVGNILNGTYESTYTNY